MLYRLAADLVLATHLGIVAFVIFGLVLTVIGGFAGWSWVKNRWYRIAHLATIGVVVFQALIGVVCPFTTWETKLRELGGEAGYGELTFVAYWMRRILFFDGEPWVFALCYSVFGLAVLATFWFVPVRWRGRKPDAAGPDPGGPPTFQP